MCAGTEDTRLVGGSKSSEGKLQVKYIGESYNDQQEWASVCNTTLGPLEARVACRSLGFYYSGFLTQASTYGVYPPLPSGAWDTVPMLQVGRGLNGRWQQPAW